MPVNDIVIRVGGESGEGIVTIGEVFVRIAAFSGFEVYTFRTFPAEILGGHVIFQARIADCPVLSQGDDIDVLVALNQEGYDTHVQRAGAGRCRDLRQCGGHASPGWPASCSIPYPVSHWRRGSTFRAGRIWS